MAQLIDFSELSARGEGLELMVRDIFQALVMEPQWTGRGADGGRDLLISEHFASAILPFARRWLVSCKDYRTKSVGATDCLNPTERCREHGATGYLIVTTSVPSSGLVRLMDSINRNPESDIRIACWDHGHITTLLLRPSLRAVLREHLPESYARVMIAAPSGILIESLGSMGVSSETIDAIRHLIDADLNQASVRSALFDPARVYPFDSTHHTDMQKAAALVLDENDLAGAVAILTTIPFEEWSAFVTRISDIEQAAGRDLLRSLSTDATDESVRFNAVQLLLDRHASSLADIYASLPTLDADSIALILDQLSIEVVVQSALESHFASSIPDELSDKATHVTITDVTLDSVTYSTSGGTLEAHGEGSLTIQLQFGSDKDQDMDEQSSTESYPYSFVIAIDPKGETICEEVNIDPHGTIE